MKTKITINNDNLEKVAYNQKEFPVYVRKEILSSYPNYAAISHWHDDVEFIYIISGQMHYSINGKQVLLSPNTGIFINSRQLHYGFSPEHYECEFLCILLHPVLLCSSPYVEQRFVTPILENESLPYLLLHNGHDGEQNILTILQEMYALHSSETFGLIVQKLFFQLWENLYTLSGYAQKKQVPRNQHLTILKDMIRFISLYYMEKITLEEICAAGKVGKTSCCKIFQNYTNQTPFSYLTEYRLKKSIDLLLTTDLTISEICFDVGFSGASYFTETFKKYYFCTPSDYRAQHS